MRKMTTEFDAEQSSLVAKITDSQKKLAELDKQDASLEHFIELVRKHSTIKRLTKSLLNEFIDFIVIHQSAKVDGRWVQQLDIYYNVISLIDLSDVDDVPNPVVEMQTRRGIVITNGKTQLEKAS
jgi:SAM-dependent MidA family methyltransferase